ncbi:hypothetical protein AVEN_82540-1 [Araneus ventricosus]|uniref:Uncharacterized protein n=1 Tax=Araneus ventricosus TaxID=182803 RepID=A0A4Y2RMN3_ARAVE|nr:hypothetical protein AVEN_82540-1 [Araneus ventricosus]
MKTCIRLPDVTSTEKRFNETSDAVRSKGTYEEGSIGDVLMNSSSNYARKPSLYRYEDRPYALQSKTIAVNVQMSSKISNSFRLCD